VSRLSALIRARGGERELRYRAGAFLSLFLSDLVRHIDLYGLLRTPGSAAARTSLLPRAAVFLWITGVGSRTFDFVGSLRVFTTVFPMRTRAGVHRWEVMSPFLHTRGLLSRPSIVVPSSAARMVLTWLIAESPSDYLFDGWVLPR